mmetsp:Transcript_55643/g.134881  ORF Transcript_55643/g.134881 Transcript_55643/m.134881 type:complete len:193 (+) Transcript_55643:106-684(+)|eukprot:CAMPEP_0113483242 /NCGR_PEP_ID=MMETSP0014_2-20120614/23332_1 /TAXON_ID=2857 /ORGANISM="Nitzschia sp." /LENGTH=192 /DNA_ID=CAMNT_0000376781 /DNA_START=106 /DNA_END=684 /DNA_ORIENTATION=- /assembly_acc=CAM_ASM_000159
MEELQGQLLPFVLLGGLTAAELWDTISVVFLSYGLLTFVPTWKYTPTLSLVAPIIHSIIYVGSLFSFMIASSKKNNDEEGDPDFSTLEGVVTMFKDPNAVFVGWIHYIAFDLLVARMICMDSIERQQHRSGGIGDDNEKKWSIDAIIRHALFVVPCMFATLAFGPTGFLLYMALRPIILPIKTETGAKMKFL